MVCLQSLSQQASFYGYSNAEPGQYADVLVLLCSWFDLDQHEVLDLKGRLLEAAGASKKHGQDAKYPLQAASYTSAVVDLNSPSWTQTLTTAGEAKQTIAACKVQQSW